MFGNSIVMTGFVDIINSVKDIINDCIRIKLILISPGPLLLNFMYLMDVINMKSQDCFFQINKYPCKVCIAIVFGVGGVFIAILTTIFEVRKDVYCRGDQRFRINEATNLPIINISNTCE